jgi:hypothetical protein
VTVGGIPTTFRSKVGPSQWTYDAPEVTEVSPTTPLPPIPDPTSMLVISGRNFGPIVGRVTVGPRSPTCTNWTNTLVQCTAPPGVVTLADVVVFAASNQSSIPGRFFLSYAAPNVASIAIADDLSTLAISVVVSGTRGGSVLNVTGASFGSPLPVSAWLTRGDAIPAPPWSSALVPGAMNAVLRCPILEGSVTSTGLSCVVPEGSGIGWRLVVVNHDAPTVGEIQVDGAGWSNGMLSPYRWRMSAPSGVLIHYRAPSITQITAPSVGRGEGTGAAPAAGGFLLRVNGSDFSVGVAEVTVGALPCVVIPGTLTHGGLLCTAPPLTVVGDSGVVVRVDGQASVPVVFKYDGPVVVMVTPPVTDASIGAQRPRLTLRGYNFGVRFRPDLSNNHTVRIGNQPCGDLVWVSDVEVSCVVGPDVEFVVGVHRMVLVVAGQASAPVSVTATCPSGTYGRPGYRCLPCPRGAQCDGQGEDPVALPGWFPVGLAQFVPCTPPGACVGGIAAAAVAGSNSTSSSNIGCSHNYAGNRCSECAVGSYRLRSKCATCPNTAWLLFLLFAIAVLAAVTGAVYLSKKRINMAGLSVGVVRS